MSAHNTVPNAGKVTAAVVVQGWRCWFRHQWSAWDLVAAERQMRRCARCGRRQTTGMKL